MTNRKPRILFAGPMLGRHPGWVPNPSEELATRLIARGYECLLVSNKMNRFHRLADILATVWKSRGEIDILCLQVYGGPSFIVEDLTSALAHRLRLPVIMHLHGGGLPDFIQHFPDWSHRVLKRAHTIVTPSAFLAQAVTSMNFDLGIIPNAIELANYPFQLRTAPGPNLLWMRTFHKIYNPMLAVEVLYQLKWDYPQVMLTMAGQDKGLLGSVKKHVSELGLTDCVHFAGFLDTKGKQHEFSRHDIFLNTNRVDNMPVSVIEAMAFGMPIIATAIGGVPFLIRDGENGLLIPNEDAKAMARSIRRLIEEPGLAEYLSRNARTFAEAFDWPAILPMWENVFGGVLS